MSLPRLVGVGLNCSYVQGSSSPCFSKCTMQIVYFFPPHGKSVKNYTVWLRGALREVMEFWPEAVRLWWNRSVWRRRSSISSESHAAHTWGWIHCRVGAALGYIMCWRSNQLQSFHSSASRRIGPQDITIHPECFYCRCRVMQVSLCESISAVDTTQAPPEGRLLTAGWCGCGPTSPCRFLRGCMHTLMRDFKVVGYYSSKHWRLNKLLTPYFQLTYVFCFFWLDLCGDIF